MARYFIFLFYSVWKFDYDALIPFCRPRYTSQLFTGNAPQNILQNITRVCLKNHSRNLHAPLCGRFHPNSVAVARYGALIRAKSPTKWGAHLAESLFQTRSSEQYL